MAQLITPELVEKAVSETVTYELKEIFKAKGPISLNAIFYHHQSLANLVLMCNLGVKTTRFSRITSALRNIIDPGRKVEIQLVPPSDVLNMCMLPFSTDRPTIQPYWGVGKAIGPYVYSAGSSIVFHCSPPSVVRRRP